MSKQDVFAILPYLKTSESLSIRGIRFRSSDNLAGLSPEQQHHLKILFSMFFLRNDLRITQMIYALLELGDDPGENQQLFQRLSEAQAVIGYLVSTPQPPREDPFLPLENASLYVFHPERFTRYLIWPDDSNPTVENLAKDSTPTERELDGYEGQRNWGLAFWVVEGNRIYPSLPRLSLNEDLFRTVVLFTQQRQNWAFTELMASREPENTAFEDRIFTALEWHNKSTADAISEEEALVHLAIAFESLLNLPRGEELSSRFKDTVMILLGPIPRLDSWLEQFYKARSAVVHEGKWPHVMFYAMDLDKKRLERLYGGGKQNNQESVIEYRALTTYGRHVFRLCLNAIVSSGIAAHKSRLSSLFVPNEERLKKMCEQLGQRVVKPEKRLRSIAGDIGHLDLYRWEAGKDVQLETVLGTGRVVIQAYLETKPELSEETLTLMNTVLQQKKATPTFEKLRQFERLASSMRGMNIPFEPESLFWIVLSFVNYVAHSHFIVRAWWELQGDKKTSEQDSSKEQTEGNALPS